MSEDDMVGWDRLDPRFQYPVIVEYSAKDTDDERFANEPDGLRSFIRE